MEECIDTARFNEVFRLETITDEQLRGVAKIRALAQRQGGAVTPYVIGAFCARMPHFNRLVGSERLMHLSPATRETKIAEFREELAPFDPAFLAICSAWCEQNGINLDPQTPQERALAENARAIAEAFPPTEDSISEMGYGTLRALPDPLLTPLEAVTQIADTWRVSIATLLRWAEMTPNPYGHPHGQRRLPDRESDAGIDLAEEVYQACAGVAPEALVTRYYRARRR